jgi:hypothetical protein
VTIGPDSSDLLSFRVQTIERNRGLFLVHAWRPSTVPEHADISIKLQERKRNSENLLAGDKIASVEYVLGDFFFGGNSVVKTNAGEQFRLDVSAYGSPTCCAKVTFKDESSPAVMLYRYCDFSL